MPTSFKDARPSRFDGPPRVIAAGYQVAEGKLIGPTDLFDDPAFDRARQKASEMANILRRQGIFEPHRLPAEEMEYTSLPKVLQKLEGRFYDTEAPPSSKELIEKEDMEVTEPPVFALLLFYNTHMSRFRYLLFP